MTPTPAKAVDLTEWEIRCLELEAQDEYSEPCNRDHVLRLIAMYRRTLSPDARAVGEGVSYLADEMIECLRGVATDGLGSYRRWADAIIKAHDERARTETGIPSPPIVAKETAPPK